MLAAWRGRVKCVTLLLESGADSGADAFGCTPLLVAAWAGRGPVVKRLLRNPAILQDILRKGEPPQSSSCGGRGPKPAAEWARRKGYVQIADTLERAARRPKQAT